MTIEKEMQKKLKSGTLAYLRFLTLNLSLTHLPAQTAKTDVFAVLV